MMDRSERYIHRVAYYETDKMGIVHHSNYVRWMEEARVWFLDRVGCGFKQMEEQGIASPVLAVHCSYKKSTTFDDEVAIRVYTQALTAIRLTVGYEMALLSTGDVVCTGSTEHVFMDAQGHPLRLERALPAFHAALLAAREEPARG